MDRQRVWRGRTRWKYSNGIVKWSILITHAILATVAYRLWSKIKRQFSTKRKAQHIFFYPQLICTIKIKVVVLHGHFNSAVIMIYHNLLNSFTATHFTLLISVKWTYRAMQLAVKWAVAGAQCVCSKSANADISFLVKKYRGFNTRSHACSCRRLQVCQPIFE